LVWNDEKRLTTETRWKVNDGFSREFLSPLRDAETFESCWFFQWAIAAFHRKVFWRKRGKGTAQTVPSHVSDCV